ILIVSALIGLALWGGAAVVGQDLGATNIAETALNIATLAAFWGAVGLFAGQLTAARRVASGIVGALIFGTYVLNNVFETVSDLKWLSWLMPSHYYSPSKPLVPGLQFNWGAWLVLVAAGFVFTALAAVMFVRRDVGATFSLLRGASAYGGSEGN